MKTRSNVHFKALTSQQAVLFPSNLSDRIPENHPVRIVNQVVDSLNIEDILSGYKGGGTSSFHPRMLIKVLFYSYFCNLYSCRKMAQALHENIHFMWLSGNSTPDFRTINDFRGKRLKEKIQQLFAELVRLMADLGYVSLDIQYIDGTKLESAANRYTFVWKGSIQKNKSKLEEKINSILVDIDSSIKQDKSEFASVEQQSVPVNSGELKARIDELNARLATLNKPQQKAVKTLQKEALPRLQKYEGQLETLGTRNSYSKTDQDATFMRMKEDHMKNGQLKPAYNTQISTENQFITNFSIHQRAGDTATLSLHLAQFRAHYHKQSKKVVADSGYGSQQNYQWMEDNDIEAFVKYNYFHKEQKRNFKKNIYHTANLSYDNLSDCFSCPAGKAMSNIGKSRRISELGYESQVDYYKAENCKECPLKEMCHKGDEDRIIEVNHVLRAFKHKTKERLLTEEGLKLRKNRAIEPEAVFGQLKSNNRFNRFKLRTLPKVNVEFGLAAIAHNLRKMVAKAA